MLEDMRPLLLLTALMLPLPAAAETCPPLPDRTEERAALFEALRDAPNERAADRIADEIWRFWLVAPDREKQSMLSAALVHVQEGLTDAALGQLDELIALCPHFPEAWNQRATLLFTMGELDASLADVEEVLKLEPKHFGALAGKAVILMLKGEEEAGQKALREALEIHPFLKERRFLIEPEEIEL